jgi:sRNA-binding protein
MTAPADYPPSPAPRPARDIVATLTGLFPRAFTADQWRPHRPLKTGAHLDLIATGILSQHEARAALRSYAGRRMYLAAVAAGGARIGLDGEIAGEVTSAESEWAQKQLDQLDAAAAAAQRQAKANARPNSAKSKAAPSATPAAAPASRDKPAALRDGLAGLRAAAAARRAATVTAPTLPEVPRRSEQKCRLAVMTDAGRTHPRQAATAWRCPAAASKMFSRGPEDDGAH